MCGHAFPQTQSHMKFLKITALVLVAVLALALIAAALLPKDFDSHREIIINQPKQEVYDYIKYIKNQDNFGVWQLSDPDLKASFEGEDGQVGFKYSWESDKLGKGSQTLTYLQEGERMESELDFGFGEPAKAYFQLEETAPDQTKVTWGLTGRSPYPLNLMNLFFDVGRDFEQGLVNLKNVLEN